MSGSARVSENKGFKKGLIMTLVLREHALISEGTKEERGKEIFFVLQQMNKCQVRDTGVRCLIEMQEETRRSLISLAWDHSGGD